MCKIDVERGSESLVALFISVFELGMLGNGQGAVSAPQQGAGKYE